MKIKLFLVAFFASLLFVSCNDEVAVKNSFGNEVIEQTEEINADSLPSVSELNENAVVYFNSIKTVILATKSNSVSVKTLQNSEDAFPFMEKLEDLEIIDEKTSNCISFFSMNESAQEEFLNDWVLLQAKQLSEKFVYCPQLEDIIKEENQVIQKTLREETTIQAGKRVIKNNKTFFNKIQRCFNNEDTEKFPKVYRSSNNDNYKIDYTIVRDALLQSGKRGDVLITLPCHEDPSALIDVSKDHFMVGHAGIISTQVSSAFERRDIVVTAASPEQGVGDEDLGHWSVKCYIVGIQRVKWIWKWRGFQSNFYKEITRVDPASLANWADSFKGHPYVYWCEFLTAKWAAPDRFTCTTLVWWCAKKAYNINVSSWLATMVTPSGLLMDDHVYIKSVVE